jgi:hypothetical protein
MSCFVCARSNDDFVIRNLSGRSISHNVDRNEFIYDIAPVRTFQRWNIIEWKTLQGFQNSLMRNNFMLKWTVVEKEFWKLYYFASCAAFLITIIVTKMGHLRAIHITWMNFYPSQICDSKLEMCIMQGIDFNTSYFLQHPRLNPLKKYHIVIMFARKVLFSAY